MAIIASKPGVGADVTVFIDTTDRTTWFYDINADVNKDTASNRVLGSTDNVFFETGKTAGITAVLRGDPDAVTFMEEWVDTLNEEKELHIRREGTGSGNPEFSCDVILTSMTMGIVRDNEQTYNLTFMPSQPYDRSNQ